MGRARALTGLANSLLSITTPAVDLTDLYRASLVLGVSALDYFVHEFVRMGMLEVNSGARAPTDAYLSFRIPLKSVGQGVSAPATNDWLDSTVREAHSWISFQHPDKIADAIRLISKVALWETVATHVGSDSKTIKVRLTAIVDRRNKIAHEADMDPTNPGHRWPISSPLVEDALNSIDQIVHAIYVTTA